MIHRIVDIGSETDEALEAVGGSFFREGCLPGEFKVQVFRSVWQALIESGFGALWKMEQGGKFVGALGGTIHPDPNDGALVAHEMFWYVSPEHRGGSGGFRLLTAFEEWAALAGARRILMAHLIGLAPERMADFYAKRGYRAVEVTYLKEI